MKKGAKLILVQYVPAEQARKAIGKPSFIGAYSSKKDAISSIEALGVEINPPEWSDEEETVPETRKIGFREPKPRKRSRARSSGKRNR